MNPTTKATLDKCINDIAFAKDRVGLGTALYNAQRKLSSLALEESGRFDMGQQVDFLHQCKKVYDERLEELLNTYVEELWLRHGGNFHGPLTETGYMHKSKLIPFLRELLEPK